MSLICILTKINDHGGQPNYPAFLADLNSTEF